MLLELVLGRACVTEVNPQKLLIDMLSDAIKNDESLDQGLMKFVVEAVAHPVDIALLRTLI